LLLHQISFIINIMVEISITLISGLICQT